MCEMNCKASRENTSVGANGCDGSYGGGIPSGKPNESSI